MSWEFFFSPAVLFRRYSVNVDVSRYIYRLEEVDGIENGNLMPLRIPTDPNGKFVELGQQCITSFSRWLNHRRERLIVAIIIIVVCDT